MDDDGHIVTGITFQTRGSQRLEGSPYDLYAPIASQAEIRPYLSGIVGLGNRIELRDLPAGRYRLVVRPPGLLHVELLIDVGLADIEFVLPVDPTLSESVSIPTVAAVTESAPVRAAMSDEPIAIVGSDRVVVTSLPSTGASSPSTTGIWKSGMMVALLLAMLAAGIAWKRTSEE